MLTLVGLGIWDERDISLNGLDACRNADFVYAELYTAKWGGSLENLSGMMGKKITLLKRKDMEENSQKLLSQAKTKDIAILVPGDPLAATTHAHLLFEARKQNIQTRVIHSSSIYTAVAVSGLSLYNFGRTVTIVEPSKNYSPTSYYDDILKNRKQGLHTLALLDIEMDVRRALEILLSIEKRRKGGVLRENEKVVSISMLGSPSQKILYSLPRALMNETLPPPSVLIIPGKLQFFEKEFLEAL